MHVRMNLPRVLLLMLAALVTLAALCACEPAPGTHGSFGKVPDEPDQTAQEARYQSLTADADNCLTVEIFNTGKSDCILLVADGDAMLIDTADADDGDRITGELKSRGIERLSYLLITHMDNDHVGSAAALLGKIEVGEVITPNYIRLTTLSRALYTAADAHDVPLTRLAEDRTLTFGGAKVALNVTHLFGDETVEDPSEGTDGDAIDDNNFSIIAHLTYKDFSALFLGDAEKARMEEFNAAFPDVKAQIVKLPHHGTYTKPLRTLLERAAPDFAVACVDSAACVESKLTDRTDLLPGGMLLTSDGTVHVATDGKEYAYYQK